MREILFKAQRADGGGWVYGDLVTRYEGQPKITHIIDEDCTYHEVLPETVGQYTGFFVKDHNGKHLFFEGDTYLGNCVDWVVQMVDGCWCFVNQENTSDFMLMKDVDLYGDLIPTGNIHDK